MEKLLTVKELAALLKVNPGSIYHWLSARQDARQEWIAKFTIRLGSRAIRFQPSIVEAALKELTGSGTKAAEQSRRRGAADRAR